ncbi:MAG: hypothetical protein AAF289_13575, partial [Cyanobacteria bacterium P01_A01_bin.135]
QQQSAGDIGISGQDNATAFVNAGTATVDQSRQTIINYYYREAIATSATASATTNGHHCQTAIALLKTVPNAHPKYAIAQQKAVEYQSNLQYAQTQAAKQP